MSSAIFKYLWKTMGARHEPSPEKGFTSLGLLLRYYGLPDITDVLGDLALRELKKDVHAAADLKTMGQLAQWLGLEAKITRGGRLNLDALPAVVQLLDRSFLVVVSQERGQIQAISPATGPFSMDPGEFDELWTREALHICPTPASLPALKVEELASALRADCHRLDLMEEFKATAVALGTYGLVYRGSLSDGTPVSIKALPSRGVGDGRVKRFMKEVEMLKRLQRLCLPGLIRIREIREEQLCYIMEWADAGSVGDLAGPLETRRAAIIFSQVAGALSGLHGHGLVHRDLSAGNILLFHGDVAKLSDFGFMFALDGHAAMRFPKVAGTYKYLSLEQATGRPINQKTDIYSFGVILHEALSGESAFVDGRVPQRFKHPPRPLPSYVPYMMADIIESCMDRDPANRPEASEIEQTLLGIF